MNGCIVGGFDDPILGVVDDNDDGLGEDSVEFVFSLLTRDLVIDIVGMVSKSLFGIFLE